MEAIRVKNQTQASELCRDIVEILISGEVVSVEVIGKVTNFIALQAIIEVRKIFETIGFDIEADPDFEQFQVWSDDPNTEAKTGIRWIIKAKEKTESVFN